MGCPGSTRRLNREVDFRCYCFLEKPGIEPATHAQPSVVVVVHTFQKVQVGKDQEKAQSERDSHSKNRGWKKPN